jgi:hypothetical protein
MNFGNREKLHSTLKSFLPETHAALTEPPSSSSARAQELAAAWEKSMLNSRAAAVNAAGLRVPPFHWALAYRM